MDESAATTSTGIRSSVRQNSREKCKLLYACVMHLYYYHNNLCVKGVARIFFLVGPIWVGIYS